jgi:tripartite-type tricarboxylate transporter receptor subunit TctC
VRTCLRTIAIIGLFLLGLQPALAQQSYPSRAVKFVVPFPPGPADAFARFYAQKLTQLLGQPVVIENRPGATGTVGADVVAHAPSDGYTLLATVDLPMVKAPNLVRVAYDPLKDLVPIAIVAEDFNVLAVHPSTNIHSLADLVAAAKAQPGKLNFSSAGNGSPGQLCGEMIKQAAGIDLTHVPYNGAGPSVTALLSGEVQLFCGPPGALLSNIAAGKITAIGVTGQHESALLPGIKPLIGTWPGVVVTNWYGFFAPAGTAPAIVQQMRKEIRAGYDDASIRERLAALGMDPLWIDGAAATKRIQDDLAKWGGIMRTANIKLE